VLLLKLLSFYKKHLSSNASMLPRSIVMNSSPQLFFQPVSGKLEVYPGHPLRVWAFGTTWSVRWYGSAPRSAPINGQKVIIIGRQGIYLLIIPDDAQSTSSSESTL
jgi:hypothetical protein